MFGRKGKSIKLLRGFLISFGTLLVLTALLALLVWRGILGTEMIRAACVPVALITGIAAAVIGARGEKKTSLVNVAVMAVTMLLAGMLISGKEGIASEALIHVACVIVPSLLMAMRKARARTPGKRRFRAASTKLR